MDFEDHDEEEIGDLPSGGGASYGTPPPPQPLGNLARSAHKMNTTPGANVSTPTTMVGSGHRKPGSGGQRYRECLKNHAVSIGGHAVDGCGEFMAAGEEGTLDALKCAACNCHRNFHRKETEGGGGLGLMGPDGAGHGSFYHQHQQQQQFSPYYRTPAGYLHQHHVPMHQRMVPPPLALPSTSGGGGSRDEEQDLSDPMVGGGGIGGGAGGGGSSSGPSKKRFRTKFTQEQKDKMLEFAEKVGWRMQKHDEAAVQQFCAETGIQRHVLKVWMHNNKHTLGKAPTTPAAMLMQHSVLQQHHQEREAEMGERNSDTPGA